jgi:hypothetical protein
MGVVKIAGLVYFHEKIEVLRVLATREGVCDL